MSLDDFTGTPKNETVKNVEPTKKIMNYGEYAIYKNHRGRYQIYKRDTGLKGGYTLRPMMDSLIECILFVDNLEE